MSWYDNFETTGHSFVVQKKCFTWLKKSILELTKPENNNLTTLIMEEAFRFPHLTI